MLDIVERKDWKIHPEIIEFYEKQNKIIIAKSRGISVWYDAYNTDPLQTFYSLVAINHKVQSNEFFYYFQSQYFTEDAMLKIIRMKAFI
jgi:hypothetical protein